MGKKIVFHIFTLLIIAALSACQNKGNNSVSKNVTGKAGELVVVISDPAWQGDPGTTIRKTLAQQQVALPQDEPLFDLIKVPPEAFTNIFKTTRNILQTRISSAVDSSGITFRNNVWARPQALVIIKAKNQE